MADFVSDFISGVFGVFNTEGYICVEGACRGGLGVTVTVMSGGGMVGGCSVWVWSIGVMWGMVGYRVVGYSVMWGSMGVNRVSCWFSQYDGNRYQ